MRFKEEACGNCGLDLTAAQTDMVREMPIDGEMAFLGACPRCDTNRIMEPSIAFGMVPAIGSPMPSANADNEGRMIRHREGSGSKTEVFVCLKNSAGDFEWIKTGEST